MTNVVNLRPCKWSSRDVEFACNIIRMIADDLRRHGYDEAADIAASWLIPITMQHSEGPVS